MSAVWWLSFADPARPKGTQFLGVAIVPGEDMVQAVRAAHRLGCNPGGEVEGIAMSPEALALAGDEWRGRLLSRAEAEPLMARILRQWPPLLLCLAAELRS